MIIVRIPETDRCDNNDGFPHEFIAVDRRQWQELGKLLHNHPRKRDLDYEEENTDGGHACNIPINLIELYDRSKVVEANPSNDVIAFIRKVERNSWFLETICERLELETTQDIAEILKQYKEKK